MTNAERQKRWRERHPEEEKRKIAEYKATHAIQVNTDTINSRAAKNGMQGKHTTEEWQAMLKICCNRCLKCGKHRRELDKELVRHFIDSKGRNSISNLQPICLSCRRSLKGDLKYDFRPDSIRSLAEQGLVDVVKDQQFQDSEMYAAHEAWLMRQITTEKSLTVDQPVTVAPVVASRSVETIVQLPVSDGKKRCTRCGDAFPHTEEYFYRKDSTRLRSECRSCFDGVMSKYRKENIEAYREQKRNQYAERPEIAQRATEKYRDKLKSEEGSK